MPSWLTAHWPTLATAVAFVVSVAASGHVILRKRDSRAAVLWVGLIWLVPGLGAFLYWALGINRIRRRAALLMRGKKPALELNGQPGAAPADEHLAGLARATDRIVRHELTAGNRFEPLENGDAAYPAMLAAIESAERSIALATYIFDDDRAGERFASALARAVKRGVQVRVLIDAVGARYSWPSIVGRLRKAAVPVATFLPGWSPLGASFTNLRNHRKILVVDGQRAFTGGMNIRAGHVLGEAPESPVRDLQFRVDGPVVAQLMGCFAEDWAFCTAEVLSGGTWFPPLEPAGTTLARAVPDGPDEDFEVLRQVLLVALASARRSVRVVTPYFVPDTSLIDGLVVAALRGVTVDIVLPEHGNIRLAEWASMALLWQVLQGGCSVHLSPAPFDHTKLFVVDEAWVLLGSANWDARSLRLNFELNVECYDPALAAEVAKLVDTRIAAARRVTLADMDGRGFPIKVRDGVAKLLSPYL
ncbi:MAG: PLDc N-terminal domain-containing protein [Polyangiaceae bacterium]|nr:PLDc N-terminal domain-containing protein [Polyangiaceae bacterium]MCE7890213.1 cardiolipin synthase [Sorangiineae bacterium PRO1]MCL4751362.1 PLDc N-terminal domain-containing protein [Myxococcales bacterium]